MASECSTTALIQELTGYRAALRRTIACLEADLDQEKARLADSNTFTPLTSWNCELRGRIFSLESALTHARRAAIEAEYPEL